MFLYAANETTEECLMGKWKEVRVFETEDQIACAIGPFEFKVEGRSKTAGTAEGCDFWDQNGVLLLHLRPPAAS